MRAEAVSADLLRGARPKRLIRQKARWYLEVVRFASKGDGVFQPKAHRIEGHPAILDALRRGVDGPELVEATSRMLAEAGADVAFDLVGGAWVPARAAPSYARELEAGERRSPAEAALSAEVVVLRATVEALMARVARLERKVAYELPLERLATGRSGPHLIDAFPRSEALADPPPVSRGGSRPGRVSATPAPAVETTSLAVPADLPAATVVAHSSRPPIRLPPLVVLVNILKDLAGQDVPLKETKGASLDWITARGRYFASWLVDDEGGEVGGVLCDAEAVARLGGALLMLPRSEIDAQATAGSPNEDAKMATSEICNNLSGPVNDVPGNPHVRAQPLKPLVDHVPEWLDSARVRLVCGHPGGGKLVLIGR